MLVRHADLGRAVDEGLDGTAEAAADAAEGATARADAVLRCPDCGQPMEKHGYMGIAAIPIDTCPACELVWVDAGELGRMRAAVAATSGHQRAREDADRRTELATLQPAGDTLGGGAVAAEPRSVPATIGESWRIFRWSVRVLRQDGEIAVCALLSLVGLVAIAGAACLTLGVPPGRNAPVADRVVYCAVAVTFLVAGYAVDTFFDCAIVATTLARLQGGSPTLGDAVATAMLRLPVIVGWALCSTIVTVARGLVERWGGLPGRLASRAAGLAWSVATFLVVPVIVVEGTGPEEALERSIALLRRTWGEQIVFRLGFRLFAFVLVLPALGLSLAGFYAFAAAPGRGLHVALWGGAVAYTIALLVLQSSVGAVFRGALYYFAVTRRVPAGLDHALLGVGVVSTAT
jgi:Zn-finger nucleic acid-binding protein